MFLSQYHKRAQKNTQVNSSSHFLHLKTDIEETQRLRVYYFVKDFSVDELKKINPSYTAETNDVGDVLYNFELDIKCLSIKTYGFDDISDAIIGCSIHSSMKNTSTATIEEVTGYYSSNYLTCISSTDEPKELEEYKPELTLPIRYSMEWIPFTEAPKSIKIRKMSEGNMYHFLCSSILSGLRYDLNQPPISYETAVMSFSGI